jgi:hypothetical protein
VHETSPRRSKTRLETETFEVETIPVTIHMSSGFNTHTHT